MQGKSKQVLLGWLVSAMVGGAAPAEPGSDLVVHEWGTFLAMNGSDGAALDGMYHEEHALPAFVHARSRDQLRIPSILLKGETPVIYFYTKSSQRVRVGVRFPQGIWTQWYPQAMLLGPQLDRPPSPAEPRNGRIYWSAVVVPVEAGKAPPALARASSDSLWNFAREVDAAYVRTSDATRGSEATETERFLFYRGLGRASLPLTIDAGSGGTLSMGESGPRGVRHVFVIRVEAGRGVASYRAALAPGERVPGVIPSLEGARPLDEFVPKLAGELEGRLVEAGLYPKEARAMVNTWSRSYFRTEGVRALFVMPRGWTDAFIPMTLDPAPRELVRVMVGRLELLTPDRERRAEAAVRDLASPDASARRRGFDALRAEGRYVEPIVRRVLATSGDQATRLLCKRLLAADFVTELRAAVHFAGVGPRPAEDPTLVRAQLASLLRDVGLDAEARSEGAAAVAALRARAEPPSSRAEAREYLRAYARAMEGLGDTRGEALWYEKFVRFGSQAARSQDCRGCHQEDGPRDTAWFRDWWAGRKYARAIARLGGIDAAIAGHEATLARRPDDVAAAMMLAYLVEEKGRSRDARAIWDRLAPDRELTRRGGPGR